VLDDVPTPAVVVDIAVLERNIASMATFASNTGLLLRPHAKTHKCWPVARRQLDGGAVGLTVATLSEAESFAAAGCRDLFVAYPIYADPARGARLRALRERCALRIGVDSTDAVEALARNAGAGLEVLVEIDSGHHRTGVDPLLAGAVGMSAERAGLVVRGVFTFPGHSYGPGMPTGAAQDEGRALALAATSLRDSGIEIDVLSGGSTPSVAHTDAGVVNEVRPGVYVFNDAQQLALGSCASADIALFVHATVVSRASGRVVLDAGSKALGADRPDWILGFGHLADVSDAPIVALSEHHGTVEWPSHSALPSVGAAVRVVPNHVCTAVNLADELHVVAGSDVVDRWRVIARGANT
jgi:D-serine deaminase-like pyridoxal phosphate-dependent protein